MPAKPDASTVPPEDNTLTSDQKARLLVNEQLRLVEVVKRNWTNYQKDGPSRRTLHHFAVRLGNLQDIRAEFRENNRQLSQLATHKIVKTDYFEAQVEDLFEESYIDVFASIKTERDKHHPPQPSATTPSAEISAIVPPPMIRQQREVPLPEVKLPVFSGEYTEWSAFKEVFMSRIHNSQQLSDQQRLQYLKGHVSGAAADDIRHITVIGDNFAIAWQALTDIYENNKLIFYHYMQIFDKQAIIFKDDPVALRSFIQISRSCLNAMHKLDPSIDEENRILVYYMLKKLPANIRVEFNHENRKSKAIPTFKNLCTVLEEHYQMMITSSSLVNSHSLSSKNEHNKTHTPVKREVRSLLVEKKQIPKAICLYCKNDNHFLRRCPPFLQLSSVERKSVAEKLKVCLNCLGNNHVLTKCASQRNCSICGARHHTLIHVASSGMVTDITSMHTSVSTPTSVQMTIPECEVLLPTAAVAISNTNGHQLTFRAFLDQGSQASFITERAVQLLQLPRRRTYVTVNGLAASQTTEIRHFVTITITSKVDHRCSYKVNAFVLKRVVGRLPAKRFSIDGWSHVNNLELADPKFFVPNQVDLLIGNNVYDSLILSGTRRLSETLPIAQLTTLGWIISGKISNSTPLITVSSMHLSIETEEMLNKIYDLEGSSNEQSTLADVELWCEQHFKETHKRLGNGQYMVRLPFKSIFDSQQVIGHSRQRAFNRFLSIERKLQRDETLRQAYNNTIEEYFRLNQMHHVVTSEQNHTKVSSEGIDVSCCYLPHHPVIKDQSTSTKVRVVYDASAKTDNGKSLNDILAVGPRLQNDLTDVLLHWRFFKVVIVADIEKMYRCIKVDYDDAQFQRILWRSSPSDKIQEFFCDVVMFGLASSPFLAIRTLHQLAEDEAQNFPLAVDPVKLQMYVDDLLGGSHSVQEMQIIRSQVEGMLRNGGFELRKWASNHPIILENIPKEHCETKDLLNLDSNTSVKTLGVFWSPKQDNFQYRFNVDSVNAPATKRTMLSTTARLFDPAGWLSPVTILARDILQKICSLKLKWDEPIPDEHQRQWKTFLHDLENVRHLQIPRWLNTRRDHKSLELHIFCDASKIAYSACAYIKTIDIAFSRDCNLLLAKSKVIPLRTELTIPRAELLAAVLAVKLFEKIKRFLPTELKDLDTHFWSDSTTVLWWINGDAEKHKVFVANRIRKILRKSRPNQWRHVRSNENPADCASRGMSALRLTNHRLWWEGPEFLRRSTSEWPRFPISPPPTTSAEILELKKIKICAHVSTLEQEKSYIVRLVEVDRSHIMEAIEKSSSAVRIARIVAYCHRFISNCKVRQKSVRQVESLMVYEVQTAVLSSHFTELIIRHSHLITLHGGVQLTLNHVRKQFWIVHGRKAITQALHRCLICYKSKPKLLSQMIGNLPQQRIRPARAFESTGVDYAGPFCITPSKGRGITSRKGYVALFICLVTKAIHLEVVSDLSSEAFLAALKRFIGRRGFCNNIFSDCGTNFVGANKLLRADCTAYRNFITRNIIPHLTDLHIQWHFIPPSSPNFGGLWEAGVKSVKTHLRRIINNQIFTYEEFSTIMCQIESWLNSRPLCPLNDDPDNLIALTPAHFLIGDSLLSHPEPEIERICLTKRWQICQSIVQQFWRRWSGEYLSRLQNRPKGWRKKSQMFIIISLSFSKTNDFLPTNGSWDALSMFNLVQTTWYEL